MDTTRAQDLSQRTPATLGDMPRVDLGRLITDAMLELARRSPVEATRVLAAGAVPYLGRVLAAVESWGSWAVTDWSAYSIAPTPGTSPVAAHTLHGIREDVPGPSWKALYDATWPSYRDWYLQEGEEKRPGLATARSQLARFMPELLPTWERLVSLTGDDELAARMLTMWDAPAFLPGCSQAVLPGEQRALVRNYDYHPDLFEWVTMSSAFTGRRVIGTSDCLWGLLDGMNEDGLVVSLTYGGRKGSAPGFAIPLVVRYLLEVATTVEEATTALTGLPVAMAYNLTISDRSGAVATVFVAPGMEPEVTATGVATNHRGTSPEDPEHARKFRSVERQQHLLGLVETSSDRDDLADAFLREPLHTRDYAGGFGTLYTAVYRPEQGTLEYRWPDASFVRDFDSPDASVEVLLHQATTPC